MAAFKRAHSSPLQPTAALGSKAGSDRYDLGLVNVPAIMPDIARKSWSADRQMRLRTGDDSVAHRVGSPLAWIPRALRVPMDFVQGLSCDRGSSPARSNGSAAARRRAQDDSAIVEHITVARSKVINAVRTLVAKEGGEAGADCYIPCEGCRTVERPTAHIIMPCGRQLCLCCPCAKKYGRMLTARLTQVQGEQPRTEKQVAAPENSGRAPQKEKEKAPKERPSARVLEQKKGSDVLIEPTVRQISLIEQSFLPTFPFPQADQTLTPTRNRKVTLGSRNPSGEPLGARIPSAKIEREGIKPSAQSFLSFGINVERQRTRGPQPSSIHYARNKGSGRQGGEKENEKERVHVDLESERERTCRLGIDNQVNSPAQHQHGESSGFKGGKLERHQNPREKNSDLSSPNVGLSLAPFSATVIDPASSTVQCQDAAVISSSLQGSLALDSSSQTGLNSAYVGNRPQSKKSLPALSRTEDRILHKGIKTEGARGREEKREFGRPASSMGVSGSASEGEDIAFRRANSMNGTPVRGKIDKSIELWSPGLLTRTKSSDLERVKKDSKITGIARVGQIRAPKSCNKPKCGAVRSVTPG